VIGLVLGLLACVISGCGGAAHEPNLVTAPPAERPVRAVATKAERDEAEVGMLYHGAGSIPGPARGGVAQASPPMMPMDASEKADVPPASGGQTPETDVATRTEGKPAVAAPMLIYKANLSMAVFETRKGIDAVEQLAKDAGGYLVSREDTRITVRVPSGKFDGTLDKITKLGDLLHRNVSVQDVTSEYFDLSIRLRNLEVMRERFEKLLEKATKVEEALAVERELARVAGEIERLKGRLKLLRELVTFSTITVEFQPRPTDHVDNKVRLPFPWLDRLGLGDLLRL
jgi:hypothetical protein